MTTQSAQPPTNTLMEFSVRLAEICEMQKSICEQLDTLLLLLKMPSESTLKVLEGLLIPMRESMHDLASELAKNVPNLTQD